MFNSWSIQLELPDAFRNCSLPLLQKYERKLSDDWVELIEGSSCPDSGPITCVRTVFSLEEVPDKMKLAWFGRFLACMRNCGQWQ